MTGEFIEPQTYKIRDASDPRAEGPIEGTFAFAQDRYPNSFIESLDSLDMTQVDEGVIPILVAEYGYTAQNLDRVAAGFNLQGIVTFGAITRSSYRGLSHLSVVARELDVPLLIAHRPPGYRQKRWIPRNNIARDYAWEAENKLGTLHGHIGSVSVAGKNIKLEVLA